MLDLLKKAIQAKGTEPDQIVVVKSLIDMDIKELDSVFTALSDKDRSRVIKAKNYFYKYMLNQPGQKPVDFSEHTDRDIILMAIRYLQSEGCFNDAIHVVEWSFKLLCNENTYGRDIQ